MEPGEKRDRAVEDEALEVLATQYGSLLRPVLGLPTLTTAEDSTDDRVDDLVAAMERRATAIRDQVLATLQGSRGELDQAVPLLLKWMQDGSVVRVVGAGRARLAAAIPANRLAHGGARVFVQDDIIPMPHTIKGGGIIAASASGRTPAVLELLYATRRETRDVSILGIADASAHEFRNACDVFIGIQPEPPTARNPLRALADSEEYVISELLDAMVVAAGHLGGFGEARWKLGHENIGATGPYDMTPTQDGRR